MGRVRDFAASLMSGAQDTAGAHPLAQMLGLEEYAPGLAFVSSLGNVTAFDTGEGLVVIDTGSFATAGHARYELSRWTDRPVHTVVYTHGHVDHVGGIHKLIERQEAPVRVVAHEAIGARFDRYVRTAGYNGAINARQFRTPGLQWPTDYRYPDVTYRDALTLEVGGARFELRHDRGETDDHTWIWVPERKALCTGDLFIWAAPNCGNPQKVQRYCLDWARALRKMRELGAETLFPGHGPPIEGAAAISEALGDTAELLTFLHDETLERMNAGLPLDAILQEVRPPAALLEKPWLRPVYDEPEFIVRNLWRLYGGWYDGDPAHLKPAAAQRLATEVAALAGSAAALVERATELSVAGEHALACHFAQWAGRAAPDDAEVRAARAEVYRRRADAEPGFMTKSIYAAAADE